MPQPFVNYSFRAFPSRRSWHPLGPTSFPAVIHPWLECVACGLIAPRFRQLPPLTKGAVARLPRVTMNSLSYRPEGLHSGRPGPPTAGPLPTTSFIRFEAFFPSWIRSRQTRVAPKPTAAALLDFLRPSRDQTLQALEPLHPVRAPKDPARPNARGRQFATQKTESTFRARWSLANIRKPWLQLRRR